MRRKTNEEFISELYRNNKKVIPLGTYKNYSTKIEVKCVSCGHVWFAWPESLIKGHGCPICANNVKKTQEVFVREMRDYNPYIEIIGEYKTALTPIEAKCRICGNVWVAKPNRLLNGAQCMNCIKPHTSFMEQFILLSLRQVLGATAVEARNTTAIGMELDIYIPEKRLAIEPGSWLYHKKKVDNIDLEKREKCSLAGIRLITIYDTYPENNDPPFDSDCFVFCGFLNEPGYDRLIDLTKNILVQLGYKDFSCDWSELTNKAYEACHYNANNTFLDELSNMAPDIESLEKYKGSNVPIWVRSKKCEHPAWKARPYTLLNGIGCPLCGRKKAAQTRTRSQQEFIDEMMTVNPHISVVSDYKTIVERVSVRCNTCGYEWMPKAYSLLSRKGCPHCSAVEGAKKRKGRLAVKSTEQFKNDLQTINSNIEVLGEYVNNKTKINVRCSFCYYNWDVVPASLLNGHGCPKCARRHRKSLR